MAPDGKSARHLTGCKATLTSVKNEIRRLRVERELTQGQLGEAMGVSRQTINAIETGRGTPSLPLAMGLARYFGTGVEEVFDDRTE